MVYEKQIPFVLSHGKPSLGHTAFALIVAFKSYAHAITQAIAVNKTRGQQRINKIPGILLLRYWTCFVCMVQTSQKKKGANVDFPFLCIAASIQ